MSKIDDVQAVPEAEYDGYVWWDDKGPEEGLFENCDALREWCLRAEREPPARVWSSVEVGLTFDAEDIVNRALESDGHHEDAMDSITNEDLARLQTYLDQWGAEAGVVTLEPNYGQSVELDPESWASLRREADSDTNVIAPSDG